MPPIERIELNVRARAYVPLDNTHSLVVTIKKPAPANLRAERAGRFAGATQNYNEYPDATDWHGRYRRIDSYSGKGDKKLGNLSPGHGFLSRRPGTNADQ